METKDIIDLIVISAVLLIILYMIISYAVLRSKGSRKHTVRRPGKVEVIHYTFHNGLKCTQEQLNLNQNEEYSKLLAQANISDTGEIDFMKLSEILYLNKGMHKLLEVILLNEKGEALSESESEKIGVLKDDEVAVVIEDFFTLNPQKKMQFEILKLSAVSTMKQVQKK